MSELVNAAGNNLDRVVAQREQLQWLQMEDVLDPIDFIRMQN